MLDEGLFGADFLVRMKRPGGSFFESITAPGQEKLAQDRAIGIQTRARKSRTHTSDSTEHHLKPQPAPTPTKQFPCRRRNGHRGPRFGRTMPSGGDFPRSDYLRPRKKPSVSSTSTIASSLNDGIENILDDYCALWPPPHSTAQRISAIYRWPQLTSAPQAW